MVDFVIAMADLYFTRMNVLKYFPFGNTPKNTIEITLETNKCGLKGAGVSHYNGLSKEGLLT